MLILLNGASSTGKSSIAKALQHLSEEPFLHIGVDTFWDMMPRHYVDAPRFESEEDKKTTSFPKVEGYPHNVFQAIPGVLKALLGAHLNVIMDDVICGDAERLRTYRSMFKAHTVYFIGVYCALDVLREREILRGDRRIGQGRAQLDRVHTPSRFYDLEVDTSTASPWHCAQLILDFISKNPPSPTFLNVKR